jgi:hypothetical protein
VANPMRGEIEVTIGGEKYPLRYEFAAIEYLERRHGGVLRQVNDIGRDGLGFKWSFAYDALFAGLMHLGNKALTVEWVRSVVSMHQAMAFSPAIVKALMLALHGPAALRDIEDSEKRAAGVGGEPENPTTADSPGARGSE